MAPVNPRVFLDLSVHDGPPQRVVFELFADKVPKTAENFRALCTGEKGSTSSGTPLHYQGSIIHRAVKDFMIQGGDIVSGDGKGGDSIYGGAFDDEDLETDCDKAGLLIMANRGPDSNLSQFIITLVPSPHLSHKHVVFGRVQVGFNVVQSVGEETVDEKHRPVPRGGVKVVRSGELELKKAPKRAASPSRSRSRSRSISRSRSRSRSASSDPSHTARKKRRKAAKAESKAQKKSLKKSKKLKLKGPSPGPAASPTPPPPEPTAEELELAAAEREVVAEKERKRQVEKEMELAELRRRREAEGKDGNGVVYKGRGRMKYRDDGAGRGGMRAWD